MYEELIKSLRTCSKIDTDCIGCLKEGEIIHKFCWLELMSEAATAIEKLLGVIQRQKEMINVTAYLPLYQKPQWISVEERLPDFEGAVLCMCKSHIRKGGKEIRYQTIMYFDEDVQWFSDVNDIFATKDAVTHWIPLPEPPKEEK